MLAAGMVDRGGIDFSLETAACKVFASELAFRAANDALQIAGGIGYSKEYPYEQAVRDSRINLIFEGTNEILRALIALMGLQQPGERLKALGKAFKDPIHSLGAIGRSSPAVRSDDHEAVSSRRVHPALVEEADRVATLVHDLALAVEDAIIKHGKEIIDKQFLQERMANAAIDIFLATAVLSRTTWEIERLGERGAAEAHRSTARASSCRWRTVGRAGRSARWRDIRMRDSRPSPPVRSRPESSHRRRRRTFDGGVVVRLLSGLTGPE